MAYKTIWEPNGVYQIFEGNLTIEDKVSANKEVEESPLFDSLQYWIIDSLAIDVYELNENYVNTAAANDIGAAYSNPTLRLAFVMTNSDHIANIKKFIPLLKETECPWRCKLFTDIGSAREWIEND